MGYINVGAFVNGDRPRTKKALREALRDAPGTVRFDQTSMFIPPGMPGTYIAGAEIPAGHTLTVVGPDPYRDRRWYASVTVDSDGKIKIK